MASELCFPISLLRARDDYLGGLTLAWANDSRGRGLIEKQTINAGGEVYILTEIENADWFESVDEGTQEAIFENTDSDVTAWAADRVRRTNPRKSFKIPKIHLELLEMARELDRQSCATLRSPIVFIPPIAWARAFEDKTSRPGLAIRDFRVLCGLYSVIGRDVARCVRRSAIRKRAFGFWARDHDDKALEAHILETQGFDLTVKMIRDSLDRLVKCREIIRLKAGARDTWYAHGSTTTEAVLKRIAQSKAIRTRSTAAQELYDKGLLKQKQDALFAALRNATNE